MEKGSKIAAKIAIIYGLVGASWILFSDELVDHLVKDHTAVKLLSIYKGWTYVIATALLLYFLVKGHMRVIIRSESELQRRNEELAETEEELRQQIEEYHQSQVELYETNQRLSALFHASPAAIIAIDHEGLVTKWNRAAERLFGWKAEEITGRPYPLYAGMEGEEKRQYLLRTLQGKVFNDVQVVRKKKTGEGLHVSLSTAPLYALDGGISGAMVLLTDITERRQAEETARASTRLYTELVNSIDGIVWELDAASFCFTFVSENAGKIVGYPAAQWLKPGFWQEHIHPEDRKGTIDQCLTSTQKGENHELEYRFLAQNGATVWLRDMVTVVMDAGKATKLRGIMFDITKRKEAEEALLSSEERYRQLFESNPHPMWVYDLESLSFLAVNDAAVQHYGYSRDEFLSLTIRDIRPPEDVPALLDEVASVTTGYKHAGVWRHRKKNGSIIMVEITSHTTTFAGRAAEVILANDITERLNAERALKESEAAVRSLNAELERRVQERTAQLEAANKELESFSYSVSHDLRAPLRHIDGFSRALLEDCRDKLDGEAKDYLMRLRHASQRMAQLIDDLLKLSRVTRSELNVQLVNLSRMVELVFLELRQTQPGRDVCLKVAGNVIVYGDARLLRVLLENLLENAWKYSGQEQHAVIEFGVLERDEPVFFIRDNGVGFDMAYADKLFAPFQRLHRADEFEGTGVGLATVQRIINRHGGRIWAESIPGSGATFYFTLSGKEI